MKRQLGAVYEALLSYRGFFAEEDLYEVKKAGDAPDDLSSAWFVPARDLGEYRDEEKVYDRDEQGRKKLRIHPRCLHAACGLAECVVDGAGGGRGDLRNVHFDTRQYNHIVWKDADDLEQQLYNRVSAVIDRPDE